MTQITAEVRALAKKHTIKVFTQKRYRALLKRLDAATPESIEAQALELARTDSLAKLPRGTVETAEQAQRVGRRDLIGLRDVPPAFTNIGRRHPHYGATPVEHAVAKAIAQQ